MILQFCCLTSFSGRTIFFNKSSQNFYTENIFSNYLIFKYHSKIPSSEMFFIRGKTLYQLSYSKCRKLFCTFCILVIYYLDNFSMFKLILDKYFCNFRLLKKLFSWDNLEIQNYAQPIKSERTSFFHRSKSIKN